MANRLKHATSPYLRQHQDNPVDWQIFGPEAIAEAQAENKPILLSIGYAACHWCHVMAHESFEDEDTAEVMNAHFIPIKVDREERPDIDAIYQSALAIMGQHGGWPLTMFLTPSLEPFAGGTYFPNKPRYGRPALIDVLRQVAEIFRHEPDRVTASKTAVSERLKDLLNPSAEPGVVTLETLDELATRGLALIDPIHGGIGTAPKFPHAPFFALLWRAFLRTGDRALRRAVVTTLDNMCAGGIYDHLGGGFARYSVDEKWRVPHFEKMLYDNGMLLRLLTLVWRHNRSTLYRDRIEETINFLFREMRLPNGAFAASLDADSEGVEGKFYLWRMEEILSLLGSAEGSIFCSVYGVNETGDLEGASVLHRLYTDDQLSPESETRLRLQRARLLEHRERRTPPGRDDKVLTDWNALLIDAVARAGAAFARPEWIAAAFAAFEFIRLKMNAAGSGARLHHVSHEGELGADGLAEDYAEMIAAALTLYEVTGETTLLAVTEPWFAELDRRFSAEGGGFYQSAADAADVILRHRTIFDNPVPPANATMLANYARAYALTGEDRHLAGADRLMTAFAGLAIADPIGAASFLLAAELLLDPITIAIMLPPGASQTDAAPFLAAVMTAPADNLIVLWGKETFDLPSRHPLFGKAPLGGRATAFVCRGMTCTAPVTDASDLESLLTLIPKR